MQENVALKPALMAPVVSNETRKAQPERGLLISRMRLVIWMDRYNSHLPIAPIPCRLLMDCRIRTHKKMMIGVDGAAASLHLRNAIAKACPCLREEYPDAAGDPVNLPGRRRGDAVEHHFRHPIRMPFRIG